MGNQNNIIIIKPHDHDILTAENGKKVQANHKGNVFFLKLLVSDYNDNNKTPGGLKNIPAEESAKRVVAKISSQKPPGRFLKQVEDDGPEELESASPSSKKSKIRWQVMTRDEAIATSILYFDKVKSELEKHKRKKKKQKRRSISREPEERGGDSPGKIVKKSKTIPIDSTKNQTTENVAETKNTIKSIPLVIEVDDDERNLSTFSKNNTMEQNQFLTPLRKFAMPTTLNALIAPQKSALITPRKNDVLNCPQNIGLLPNITDNHDGNQYLERVIRAYVNEYMQSKLACKNSVFVDLILKKVREQTPPARFLTLSVLSDGSKEWALMSKDNLRQDIQARLENTVMQSVRQSEQGITKPRPQDFLFGQEGKSNNGNKVFYEILVKYKADFQKQAGGKLLNETDQVQTQCAQDILEVFRDVFTPPGRFLKKDDLSGLWYDVGAAVALRQTKRVLNNSNVGPNTQLQPQQQMEMLQSGIGNESESLDVAAEQLLQKLNTPKSLDVAAEQLLQKLNKPKPFQQSQQVQHQIQQQQVPQQNQGINNGTQANVLMNIQHQGLQQNALMGGQINYMTRNPSVLPAGATADTQINQATSVEYFRITNMINKQIKDLDLESFRSQQLQEQYTLHNLNSKEQLGALKVYKANLMNFGQQFQYHQNADQQRIRLRQIQTQFQLTFQQLQLRQQQKVIQQQEQQRKEIQMQQQQQSQTIQQQQQQSSLQQQQKLVQIHNQKLNEMQQQVHAVQQQQMRWLQQQTQWLQQMQHSLPPHLKSNVQQQLTSQQQSIVQQMKTPQSPESRATATTRTNTAQQLPQHATNPKKQMHSNLPQQSPKKSTNEIKATAIVDLSASPTTNKDEPATKSPTIVPFACNMANESSTKDSSDVKSMAVDGYKSEDSNESLVF